MKSKAIFGAIVATTLTFISSDVSAQSKNNRVSGHADWSVFVGANPKVCWAGSPPTKTVNTRGGKPVDVRRGDIALYVSYSPTNNARGQVSFTGGYPFATGSTVELTISGQRFTLNPSGEWAWPANAEEDQRIIAAMKKGNTAVLSARSGRGTLTKDTFSLLGFTASTADAKKRCS